MLIPFHEILDFCYASNRPLLLLAHLENTQQLLLLISPTIRLLLRV